jgi:hypothetical protein
MLIKDRSFAAIAICAVSVVAIFFVFCSIEPVDWLFTNSDSLLPADLVNDFINHPQSIAFFQFPRIPSFFPDLLFYFIITVSVHSWIAVLVLYACTMLFLMILACSIICCQISRTSLGRAIMTVLSCTIIALIIATVLDGPANGLLYIMIPVYHSGPFLAALYGLILAKYCFNRPSQKSHIALVLIAVLGTLSDRLFIGAFLIPLLGFVLVTMVATRGDEIDIKQQHWKILGLAAMGCAAGYASDLLIFSHWLLREPDLPIDVGRRLDQLNNIWLDGNVWFETFCTIFVLAVSLIWTSCSLNRNYWLAIASASTVGFLLILPLLWDGWPSTRYVQPIWWWALVIAAATLSRIESRFVSSGIVVVAIGMLIAFTLLRHDAFEIRQITNRREPLEACLIQLKKKRIIGNGFADYWVARPMDVESDWRLQVDQITPPGTVFIWGSNTRDYLYSREFPSQRATFDFILIKGLEQGQLARRFGLPDKVATCPTSAVWIYRDQNRLRLNLGGIATSADKGGLLNHAACLGPGQFTNQSGPIPSSGVDMSADAQPRSFATWGPYIGMRRGPWVLDLTYRLTKASAEAAIWDVAADDGRSILERGELKATDGRRGSQAVTLDLERDTPFVEFRTSLSARDHFEIIDLRIRRPGDPNDPCKADASSG